MQRLQLRRTLLIALILSVIVQLWGAAGIAQAAAGGPVLVSSYPLDNDTTVPANAKLKLVFDENVTKGSGTIAIKESSTNVAVVNWNVTDAHVSFQSSNTVVVDTAGQLQQGKNYYVQISANAFQNASGVGYAGLSDATEWNFGVIASDSTAPMAGLSPTNGGTMLSTDSLKLAFNEKVFAASGYVRIVRSGSTDMQLISVLSSAVQGSGSATITIQPPTRLVSGQSYQVLVDNSAFVDVVGNAYVPTAWSFTTTGPAVSPPTSLYPIDNATGVSTGVLTAKMMFPAAMKKTTNGTIQLKRVSDNNTIETINMSSQGSRVTLTDSNRTVNIAFSASLAANTGYYILIDPGVLLDGSDNVYEGMIDAVSWNFTTQSSVDNTPPTIDKLSPVNGGATTSVNGPVSVTFNEPVKVGSGSIVIQRISSPYGVFCSIPVTSAAIVGSGTNTLSITPSLAGCGNFVANAQYSVQINSLTVMDLAGNYYPGNGLNSWTFRISSDTVAPELVSTTPASGSQAVKTTDTFTMTFSEEIAIPSGVAELIPSTGSKVTAVITRDASDYKKAKFTATGLRESTSYVIRIPNNAITDLAGNAFPGILNDYRWTFKTIGSDRTAPRFSSAAMDGSAIVLTYDEELDAAYPPYPGNYYVTVNDVPRQVNAVAIVGSTVRLTLQSGVAVGQVVKVSYTSDADPNHQLKDLSGNKAAALTAQAVTNTTDTTLPRPVSGIVVGSTLMLTFNKSLQALSSTSTSTSQFTVKVNGYSQSISSAEANGTMLTLTLYSAITSGQSVSVSYASGSYPLRDTSGNAASSFSDFYVQSTNDTTPPVLSTVTGNGTSIRLTYNEGLRTSPLPSKSNFSVITNGKSASISSVSVSNNVVILTLSQALATGSATYVTYVPGSPGIADLSGNLAATFSNQFVTLTTAGTTDFLMAAVTNSQLSVFYNGNLSPSYVPYASQFVVRAGTVYYGVTAVSIQNAGVLLTLATPVPANVSVTVSYNKSGISLRDSSNVVLESFTDKGVINTNSSGTGTDPGTGNGGTTTPTNLPDYLESDGNGGVRFLVDKVATREYATLPSGGSGYRYNIDGAKLSAAYDVIRSSSSYGVSKPILTFKVPATEQAGLVTIPIQSMMEAASKASNASFRVEYGDLQFTLPLTAVNYSRELYLANATASSARLQLSIEKTQDNNLSSAVNLQSAQLLASPTDFAASLLFNGVTRPIDSYDLYVTRSFKVPSFAGTGSDVAVVRYDSDAGDLVYVPTKLSVSGGTATVDFKRKSNSIYTVVRKQVAFTDTTKHWANATISELASKFIVEGPTRKTFAPDKNITRADFAEYLARGLGLNGDKSSANRYTDVSASNASAAFIGAVSKAGIVEGGNDGTFRPNASITREEMATMLVRAMNYAGVSTVSTSTALNAFKDKSKVSTWAKDGMSICVMAGLIKGATPTELKPQNNATRAEAATMLQRFLQYADLL